MRNKSLRGRRKRKTKDRMGRTYGVGDKKKGKTLTGGDQAGEGQESVPEVADATCRLNRQQGKTRRKKNYLLQNIRETFIYIYIYIFSYLKYIKY